MNTNMYSEAFYRVLKIGYLRHKQNKRVDYPIIRLLSNSKNLRKEKLSHDPVFPAG